MANNAVQAALAKARGEQVEEENEKVSEETTTAVENAEEHTSAPIEEKTEEPEGATAQDAGTEASDEDVSVDNNGILTDLTNNTGRAIGVPPARYFDFMK